MRRAVLVVIATAASAVAASAHGAVTPYCGSTGVITSYCVTWQTDGFGGTSVNVENDGAPTITGITFTLSLNGNTITGVTGAGSTCVQHGGSQVVCTNTDLESGFSLSFTLQTAVALAPPQTASLVLSIGSNPATPQPAQSVELQSAATSVPKTKTKPSPTFAGDISKAEQDARLARHDLAEAIYILSGAKDADQREQVEKDIKSFNEMAKRWRTSLAAAHAVAPEQDRKDIARAEVDVSTAENLVDKAGMQMTVTDEPDFTPSKFIPEFREAEADAEAAAGLM